MSPVRAMQPYHGAVRAALIAVDTAADELDPIASTRGNETTILVVDGGLVPRLVTHRRA